MEETKFDTESDSHLQDIINTHALELVRANQAKWIYCNEGNNNIAVIFKITSGDVDKKYKDVLQLEPFAAK